METFIEVVKVAWFVLAVVFGLLVGTAFGFSMWIDKRKKRANQIPDDQAIELEMEGYLVLSPSGDTQDFIFAPPEHMSSCGKAYFGMSLDGHKYYWKDKDGVQHSRFSGGVLGLEDCIRLRNHLNKHIEIAGRKKED